MTEPKLLPLRSRLFSLLILGFFIFVGLQSLLILIFFIFSKSSHIALIALVGVIALISSLLGACYVADQLAIQISKPLKELVEALTLKSAESAFLKLPKPHSLETRILFHEIQKLWRQLRELKGIDTEKLVSQNTLLQGILEALGDAVLLLNAEGQILYCNEIFSSLIQVPQHQMILHQWTDLGSLDPNYLSLRELLSNPDQTEIFLISSEQKGRRDLFRLKKISVHLLKSSQVKSSQELYFLHREDTSQPFH